MTLDALAAPSHTDAAATAAVRRLNAVDTARFFGIVLVYYGHVVEQSMYLGNAAAEQHYKLIYSFHMPLFFVLSGIVAKDWGGLYSPAAFVKTRLASRVLPLLVFSLAMALISLMLKPDFPPVPLRTAADYGNAGLMTFTRLPLFDIPTWFLMCLVSVEVIHAVIYRFVKNNDVSIVAAIVLFYVVGYSLNSQLDFFGMKENFWFWNEAITMYAFYLTGVLMARRRLLELRFPKPVLAIAGLAVLGFVVATYDLNDGPFRMKIPAVVILAAAHGQMLWFVSTALAGTAAVLLLAWWVSPSRWLELLGRNALVLFCLNGVVYHHVNTEAARWFADAWPQSGGWLFVYAAALTTVSLAVAVPLGLVFDRFVPQLVGRPSVAGPWLPALVRP